MLPDRFEINNLFCRREKIVLKQKWLGTWAFCMVGRDAPPLGRAAYFALQYI
jgi:hypothetical protein